MKRLQTFAAAIGLALFSAAPESLAAPSDGAGARAYKGERHPADEIIYFVLQDRFENGDPSNDRAGIEGGPADHGFDPEDKGFFHGGDLAGLTARLDYIKALGATAIWLGPIYKNKPVQGEPGFQSAGYHGYWITDFTSVDPHFGTRDDLKTFIEAAHERDMKVYFDIITNHTADVIAYRECHEPAEEDADKGKKKCPYRSKADYPYTTRSGVNGDAINDGFMGDGADFQSVENFERLTRADFAYTPYIPEGQENVKKPAWLNNILYYHNRGETTFKGESSTHGDFFGLDDLQTEDPRVVQGFIDIYKDWITEFKIDGFRIDTARHVNPEFWRAFLPAILDHAEQEGVENFYIFGEVYDPEPAGLARYSWTDDFPALLDFAFQDAAKAVVADGAPATRFADLFNADVLYRGGEATPASQPVFLGNHDMGRFGYFLRAANPDADDETLLKQSILGHAMMFFMRGAPVIYYGDEQGFTGDGGDKDARENMFESRVASYNDNDLIGTDATTRDENFDTGHPIFRAIQDMAAIYKQHAALRRGRQVIRMAEENGGMIVMSRLDDRGREYLVAFNANDEDRDVFVSVDARSRTWEAVAGNCAGQSAAVGSVRVRIPALEYIVCVSNEWKQ